MKKDFFLFFYLFIYLFIFSDGRILQSDWFFTQSVFSYLCPRARVTFSWVAEYIPSFVGIFINIFRFTGWAVFLSKDVGHYLKLINNLWILSFLSLKSLCLTEKCSFQNDDFFCISNSVITLVDRRPKNRLQLILIVHKKYLES